MSDSLVEPAASVDVAQSWFIGLQAILGTGLIWVAQAIFLCEVPLLRGRAPNLGLNLRVAVWVNLPLALLVIVQTLFVSSGGQLGQPGLSGLLVNHPAYLEWPLILRELAMTLSSQMTLFWLWSMALLYMGARRALHGSRWMALLVVLLWTLALSIVPTALRLLQGAS